MIKIYLKNTLLNITKELDKTSPVVNIMVNTLPFRRTREFFYINKQYLRLLIIV